MTSTSRYDDYFRDILDAIRKATLFVDGMSEPSFRTDEKTQYAVIRAIEIIGEASKRIPEDIRRRYPSIPWREMTGMRDKLIHNYSTVNLDVVWKTVVDDLPALEPLILAALEDYMK
jgi:uncharacterized protein with HEPN domain